MNVLKRVPKSLARRVWQPIVAKRERRSKGPLYTPVHGNLNAALHIREAAEWLCRAQDHGNDAGVAYGAVFGEDFLSSYPETTGYIICTFLRLARHYGDEQFRNRAIRMGKWEIAIQMDCGAAGMYRNSQIPAVFDTGMVLLGYADLYRETRSEAVRVAGERAAQWLVSIQDTNGSWESGNDHGYADAKTTTYNVKAAWGLAEMGAALENESFVAAAVRNAEFTLTKQTANGWFKDCCISDPARPLLHTMAYTMQGLVGIGKLTGHRDLIEGAAKMADSLVSLMSVDGFLPGRIDKHFGSAANWCCLTGTAQTSIVWSDLAALSRESKYAEAAERANRYLMARHDVSSSDPRIRGALAGSWPVWGEYRPFHVLNWATKFLCDALLMQGSVGAPLGETLQNGKPDQGHFE
jgi:hypothetical protein